MIEEYKTDDAEIVLLSLGSVMGTVKDTVDKLRKDGKKIGAIKIRVYRPFPEEELINALEDVEFVGVIDKNISLGKKGALYTDLAESLRTAGSDVMMANFIMGLGGRDVTQSSIKEAVEDSIGMLRKGRVDKELKFIDIKEAGK